MEKILHVSPIICQQPGAEGILCLLRSVKAIGYTWLYFGHDEISKRPQKKRIIWLYTMVNNLKIKIHLWKTKNPTHLVLEVKVLYWYIPNES